MRLLLTDLLVITAAALVVYALLVAGLVVAVALVLRLVLRGAGPDAIREHWPGPERSLRPILRLAGG